MRVVILSACPVGTEMKSFLQKGDYIIACDAGYRNAELLGVQPDIIVGDFDSAPKPTAENLVVLPHVKDDTDTQYAARLADEKKAQEVLILGGLGGKRLEHTLSNIGTLLWLEKRGIHAMLADAYSTVEIALPGKRKEITREGYTYLSLIPLDGRAEGVNLTGTFYPLQDAVLSFDYASLSTSNEFLEDRAYLFAQSGAIAVIKTREDRKL